ncbi:MAG: hypothetical protein Q7T73_09940 [Beijerinckiaceae bacterium]|jgi:hypothetical protein|nr:hypothetical protein [Beijerinckiaceae bacterium]
MTLDRKRGILATVLGTSLIVVVVFSESLLEAPKLYADSFCLLDKQNRTCAFKTLSQCMANMPGTDSECIRELVDEKLAREK